MNGTQTTPHFLSEHPRRLVQAVLVFRLISLYLESHFNNPVLKRTKSAIFYPDFAPKMHKSSSSISKRLCSISHLHAGPFQYSEHKNAKK
jgi:hypothetical protein